MNKTEFVTHLIQHDERFPYLDTLSLASAQAILDHIDPAAGVPAMDAEELMETWNTLIQDPAIMEE